jgi:antibiotic biosynthesis monooxygenase (ABM) superfamily enzyme
MASEPILMITGVDCAPGKEKEFNEWYNTNFAEIISKVPGVVRVDRYERVEDNVPLPGYISIVELENIEAWQNLQENKNVSELGKLYIEKGVNYGIQFHWVVRYKQIYSSAG